MTRKQEPSSVLRSSIVGTTVTDKITLFQWVPWAAEAIFSYRKALPELANSPWGFDSGHITEDGQAVTGYFSMTSVTGRGIDRLSITAVRREEDQVNVSHRIQGA